MSEEQKEEQQQPPAEPEPEHEHKWVQKEKKIYDPTKGPETRNAHVVTKIIYVCETCGKRKIERDKPVIDTEKETVFM